jgi:hypothetical protein
MKEARPRCGYPNSIAGRQGPVRPASLGIVWLGLSWTYKQYPQVHAVPAIIYFKK